jgi:hypothetical protein
MIQIKGFRKMGVRVAKIATKDRRFQESARGVNSRERRKMTCVYVSFRVLHVVRTLNNAEIPAHVAAS